MREKLEPLVREFKLSYIGFVFLLTVTTALSRMSTPLPAALRALASPDICMFSLSAGCLVSIIFLGFLQQRGHTPSIGAKAIFALAFSLGAFGIFAVLLFSAVSSLSCFVYIGYAMLGFGFTFLFVGWLGYFSSGNTPALLVYVPIFIFLSAILQAIIQAIPSAKIALGIFCILMVLSALLLVGGCRYVQQLEPDRKTERSNCSPPLTKPPSNLKAIPLAFTPALAWCLSYFNHGALSVPETKYAIDHFPLWDITGDLIVVLVFILIFFTISHSARLAEVKQRFDFMIPMLAIFVGCFAFVRMLDADGYIKHVLSLTAAIGGAGLQTLFISLAAAEAQSDEQPIERYIAIPYALLWGFFFLGLVLMRLIGNQALYIEVIMTMVFLVALFWSQSSKSFDDTEENIRQRCRYIAEEYELTNREREVFELLALDYPISEIANQLFISPDTVTTHRKRIYNKLDIHKREELAKIVREAGASTSQ